ncbi:hypothetical protein [Anatilimnocola floriformis]|uniref:hypothetical protein n=1 Tax=Anatilimnocola floriformis TaxID=2948575 RepID=UPI0020C2B04C|nr:hypothetical protein [Anatilimnocola floriformis]
MFARTAFATSLIVFLLSLGANARTWKSADGKSSVEGEMVESVGATVKIKTDDGRELNIPLSKLSQADRDFVLAERKKKTTPAANASTGKPMAEAKQVDEAAIRAELEKMDCECRVNLDGTYLVNFQEKFQTGDVVKALPLLKQLKALHEIQLDDKATDEDLKALTELKGLKDFNNVVATSSQVTDAGLLELKALPNLKYINVIGAKKITEPGIRAAFNAIPTLELVHLKLDDGIKR